MEELDVVIIGSGYGGSVLAARLAATGLTVLVLERGPRRGPENLEQSDDPKYIVKVIDLFVSTQNIAFRTGNLVGGASIAMDGAHFRMPQKSFDVVDDTDRRVWPGFYTRASLDPYYLVAEQMLEVRQFPWTEIPKAGGLFAKMLDAAGASCDRARMNYADCLQCGFCSQGCIYDKKRSVLQSYIPAAEADGAEFRSGAEADHIEPSGTGYVVAYSHDDQEKMVRGDRVIVACGGIHSPALLLRSAQYLPNLSEQTGKNFNFNGEHSFVGILPPEFDDLDAYDCFKGMDNAGVMSYHWFESDGITLHPGAGFEPTVFAANLTSATDPAFPSRAWGMEYKRFVESVYPHRLIGFAALGLVESHLSVVLRANGTTDVSVRDRTAFDTYLDRLDAIIAGIAQQSGVSIVPTLPRHLAGTTAAHLLSACRLGDSAATGVVDEDCRVFDYENLYVCDASVVPHSLGVNPALTISAIAERAAERILASG